LEGTPPGIMLIVDVHAEIMHMMKYNNLQPTVNIQRAKGT
jgi:hypothetical protein